MPFYAQFANRISNCNITFACNTFCNYQNYASGLPDKSVRFAYGYNFNGRVVLPDTTTDCGDTFKLCYSFNQPVTIPSSTKVCSWMFASCYKFNQPVIVHDNVTRAIGMFSHCNNLNSPIVIGNNVVDADWMFNDCYNFNQPIRIPDSVNECASMFSSCYNFNSEVIIGNNVAYCAYMFSSCYNFNRSIVVPASAVDCDGLFHGCNTLNSPITFIADGINITHAEGMFAECHNFNQPVKITGHLLGCKLMFSNCQKISDITIPNMSPYCTCDWMFHNCYNLKFINNVSFPNIVEYCNYVFCNSGIVNLSGFVIPESNHGNFEKMFSNCHNLRSFGEQSITIPNNAINCMGMFYNCENLAFENLTQLPNTIKVCINMFCNCGYNAYNSPFFSGINLNTTIPENAIECAKMFSGSPIRTLVTDDNGYISIPYGAKRCGSMFLDCKYFNAPVNIPDTVEDCRDMFKYCTNLMSAGIIPNSAKLDNMYEGCTNLSGELYVPDNTISYAGIATRCGGSDLLISIPSSTATSFLQVGVGFSYGARVYVRNPEDGILQHLADYVAYRIYDPNTTSPPTNVNAYDRNPPAWYSGRGWSYAGNVWEYNAFYGSYKLVIVNEGLEMAIMTRRRYE